MYPIRFNLLGSFEIIANNRKLPKPATQKSQSLLAYLVLHRHAPPVTREFLAGLFWGDRPDSKARGSLATALWHIHRCLPGNPLLTEGETVRFDPHADLCLDVEEFTACLTRDDVTAVTLYRGDLLDGFYDDWIVDERYRLESLYCEALVRLMSAHEAADRFQDALTTAENLLRRDPLREDAHRLVMRAHCHLGQRNSALTHYQNCRDTILAELGTEPMEETTDLYRSILDGRFKPTPAPASPPAATPPPIIPVSPARDPLGVTAPVRLLGRDADLTFLHRHWEKLVERDAIAPLLFISGEAGIGKTRLVDEFANRLRAQGIRILSGRCYEFERILPYQPIVETLRSVLPSLSASEQALFPRWLSAEVTSPDFGSASSQNQALLFESVAVFLRGLSDNGPILVVLEDFHWAAESTLAMLHYLTRHVSGQPVMLVATVRSEDVSGPLKSFQQTLEKEKLSMSIHLSRLSASAVDRWVAEMSGGGEVVIPLAERLYRETDGNPFFMMETVKTLFETGWIHMEAGAWKVDTAQITHEQLPLAESISATILARVQTLSDAAQSALRMASILGREFDFDLLNHAWGRGDEATLEALDTLLRARLIEEGKGQSGRDYVFVHHKIQEAVYADIPRKQCQHGHARVAAAMEKLYAVQLGNVAGEIAYHFEKSCDLTEAHRTSAVKYLLQAGDRARGLYAFQDAADYYKRAVRLIKETQDYEAIARAQMKLGLALHNAFEFDEAQKAYEESFAATRKAMTVKPGNLPPAPHALHLDTVHPLDSKMSLDPLNFENQWEEGIITAQLFARLVELSPELDILPDIARDWQVLENGSKYIFHLREDVFWSDGTPLTAVDFELGLWRMVSAETGSLFNFQIMSDIKGVSAFRQGQAEWHDVGFRALDPKTILIELENPTAYFLEVLTFLAPVPKHRVEALGNSWAEPDKIVTYGAFLLESWEAEKSMRLVRNPIYRGLFPGNVQHVELTSPTENDAPTKMEELRELDVLDVDRSMLKEASSQQRDAGNALLSLFTPFCLIFDTHEPPFNDRRVRQAFILALDREELAKVQWWEFNLPASGGLIPPGMTGHTPGIALPFDPPRARDLLAASGYPGGRGFPAVEIWYWHAATIHEWLVAQWQKNLGIQIPCKVFDYREWVEKVDDIHRNLHAWGIIPDYPDPDSLLRVIVPRWGNPRYDELVEQARRLQDHAQRMQLYRQAEEILAEDAAIVPLLYHCFMSLAKPWVKNYSISPTGVEFWKYVILEPH